MSNETNITYAPILPQDQLLQLVQEQSKFMKAKIARRKEQFGNPYLAFFNATSIRKRKDPYEIQDFERQPGVVIATKIHGENTLFMLEQSLCLLHHAYNYRMLYDIVVFTTDEISEEATAKLKSFVSVCVPKQCTFGHCCCFHRTFAIASLIACQGG